MFKHILTIESLLSLIVGVMIAQLSKPSNDLAHAASDAFLSLMIAGILFYLGKILCIVWENNFERSFFSQLFERFFIVIIPMTALVGPNFEEVIHTSSLFFLGFGVVCFVDIGNLWRSLISSKLLDNEIEKFFLWSAIPIKSNSKVGVGIFFALIYCSFAYTGLKMAME